MLPIIPGNLKINLYASNIHELFCGDDWKLKELFANVYEVYKIDNTRNIEQSDIGQRPQEQSDIGQRPQEHTDIPLNIIVKTKPIKTAKNELAKLLMIQGIQGVPIVYTTVDDSVNYTIIMSKAPGEDLFKYIEEKEKLPVAQCKIIVKNILKVLSAIHANGIIHGDIIYDDSTNEVTLVDFESKYTEDYVSPEIIRKDTYITGKTDIWSLGITLYVMLTAYYPFNSKLEMLKAEVNYPKEWDNNLKDFLSCLLEPDATLRYSAEEALAHCWLN